MTADSVNQWSTIANNNSLIASTNIAVGCAPQDVGVFMRTTMQQIAYAVQGTGGLSGTLVPATWNCGEIISQDGTIGTLAVTNLSVSGGTPPGVQFGDLKPSALGIEGGGWRLCYGQTRPQTDPFWVYMVANGLTAGWEPGFTGSSTYNMPDARDVVFAGLGNMGGTDRGLLTAAVCGFDPTILLNSGGSQLAQADTITVSQSGSITASAENSVSDPGHLHSMSNYGAGGSSGYNAPLSGPWGPGLTGSAATGISVTTSVSITNGLTIAAASSLTGTSQNIQPTMMAAVLMFVGA